MKEKSQVLIKKPSSEFNNSLKLLVRSSVVVFVGVVLSKVLAYLYRIVVARYYGPEAYGLFALSFMVIGWASVIAGLGISEGLTRYIPYYLGKKEKNKVSCLFNISFKALIILGLLAGGLLFILSDVIAIKIFSNSELAGFLRIFSFSIPISAVLGILLVSLRSYEKIGWFSFISNILENTLRLIILFVLIFVGIGSSSIAYSVLAGVGATLLISWMIVRKVVPETFEKGEKIEEKEKKKLIRDLFSYSWPLIFSGILLSVFYWTDTFFIGFFRSVEEVGFYNAAVPIAILLTLPKALFTQLFFPMVTREYGKGNIDVVRQLSKQVGKWIFVMSAPLFVLIMIFPGVFINLLFGPEYLVAENALRFLTIGVLFTTQLEISKDLLSMKGKSKMILGDIVFAAILNVVLNLFLIPKYGISGAGFATMVSLIFLNSLFLIQSAKYLSIVPARKKMIGIFISAAIPAAIVLVLRSYIEVSFVSIIALGALFMLLYLLLFFAFRSLDKNDYLIIEAVKNKIYRVETEAGL